MVCVALSRFYQIDITRNFLKEAPVARMLSKCFSSELEERKLTVGNVDINYLKVGSGPHHVLCTPGALGSIWTDFKPQIEYLDRTKFTLIAWDPPGYGKSRPPLRDFSHGFYERDCDWALALMEKLNIPKYSMLGWSNGGIASMILAAKHPDRLNKLVIWGSNSYVTKPEIMLYDSHRDPDKLSPKMKAPKVAIYGENGFQKLWVDWIDATIAVFHSDSKGDICKQMLSHIKCPTLMIQGGKDMNVAPEHSQFIAEHIPGCRLLVMKDGKHNLHLRYWKEFNQIVEEFLLE